MKLLTKSHEFRETPRRVRGKLQLSWRPIIDEVNSLLDDYTLGGFTPTLRQLFYRLVSKEPHYLKNTKADYRNLGRHINEAKEGGYIDWDAVEDRTRYLRERPRYANLQDFVDSLIDGWHMDFWTKQLVRPEIWVEKDALLGILEPVCRRYDVGLYSLRGWGRPADNFAAAQRFLADSRAKDCPLTTRIFHLGDHDPTGCAVTGQLDEKIREYATKISEGWNGFVEVRRLGLMCDKCGETDQIAKYNLSPNRIGDDKTEKQFDEFKDPKEKRKERKEEESRKRAYVALHDGCEDTWELDALAPADLQDLVEKAIKSCIEFPIFWDDRQEEIAAAKRTLVRLVHGEETPA